MVAVASDHRVPTGSGKRRTIDRRSALTCAGSDCPLSAGGGAHGHRCDDWALIGLQFTDGDDDRHGGHHALLVRRHRRTGEMACSHTWTPTLVPLPALVTVAGRRWTIEEAFQAGNGLAALDEHQVRQPTSRRRWTVLAMLARATLTAATPPPPLDEHPNDRVHHHGPTRIPLTRNEVQRLIAALISPVRASLGHVLA